jgi:hypothetical protein
LTFASTLIAAERRKHPDANIEDSGRIASA